MRHTLSSKLFLALVGTILIGCGSSPAGDESETTGAELRSRNGIDFAKIRFSVAELYEDSLQTCLTFNEGALDYHKVLFVGAWGDLRAVSTYNGFVEGPNGYQQICLDNSTVRYGERVTVDFVRTDLSVLHATFDATWVTYSGQRYLNSSELLSRLEVAVETLPSGSNFEGRLLLEERCLENPFSCSEERKHAP